MAYDFLIYLLIGHLKFQSFWVADRVRLKTRLTLKRPELQPESVRLKFASHRQTFVRLNIYF